MDAQRARIKEMDETNALMDDPIEMPSMKFGLSKEMVPAWPYGVYLRLPTGFGTTPKEATPYYENFPFFRYSGNEPNYNLFVAAALIAESDAKQDVAKYVPKNFRAYIRKAIEDYYFKEKKIKLVLPEKVKEESEKVKRFVPYPEDDVRIVYTVYEYRDTSIKKIAEPSVFRVYLTAEENKQFCIVAHRPLGASNEQFDKAFKACLGTLDIGPDAASKRSQFTRTRR
jgi:hypothetical protein